MRWMARRRAADRRLAPPTAQRQGMSNGCRAAVGRTTYRCRTYRASWRPPPAKSRTWSRTAPWTGPSGSRSTRGSRPGKRGSCKRCTSRANCQREGSRECDRQERQAEGPDLRQLLEIEVVRVPDLVRDRAVLVPVLLVGSGPRSEQRVVAVVVPGHVPELRPVAPREREETLVEVGGRRSRRGRDPGAERR